GPRSSSSSSALRSLIARSNRGVPGRRLIVNCPFVGQIFRKVYLHFHSKVELKTRSAFLRPRQAGIPGKAPPQRTPKFPCRHRRPRQHQRRDGHTPRRTTIYRRSTQEPAVKE